MDFHPNVNLFFRLDSLYLQLFFRHLHSIISFYTVISSTLHWSPVVPDNPLPADSEMSFPSRLTQEKASFSSFHEDVCVPGHFLWQLPGFHNAVFLSLGQLGSPQSRDHILKCLYRHFIFYTCKQQHIS